MNSSGEDVHQDFRGYLSRIHPKDLKALRHLLACPVCQEMTRLLLGPAWAETPPSP